MCLDIVLTRKRSRLGSRLGHSRVSSRSRLGQFGKCLGLVSVSGAQVSVLVSVSTQKVLGPSLVEQTSKLSVEESEVFKMKDDADVGKVR